MIRWMMKIYSGQDRNVKLNMYEMWADCHKQKRLIGNLAQLQRKMGIVLTFSESLVKNNGLLGRSLVDTGDVSSYNASFVGGQLRR